MTLRVALAGLGHVAERIHLPALRQVEGLEVVAGCDPDAERRRVAAGLDVERRFEDPGTMLAEVGPDALVVGTPPRAHHAVARAALEAGAHVFCEKPFTATLEEADDLIRLARERRLHLRVNNQYRYMRTYRETRQRLAAGDFGRPFFLQCWQQMYHPPGREANWRSRLRRYTLFEFGTHALDLICYLFDALPGEVQATIPDLPHGGAADVLVQATLRFPEERLATLALNRVSHAPERYLEMRLDCELASLRLSFGGVARASIDWRRRLRRPSFRFSLVRGGEARAETGGRSTVIARDRWPAHVPATAEHLRRFTRQIERGEISTAAAEHNREILRLALAGYEAAESGETVRLDRQDA